MEHPTFDYAARTAAARRLLAGAGLDALALSLGADLPYFSGYEAMPMERLTMLLLPARGDGVLLVPRLEAPRVVPREEVFETRPWEETEDPVELVAGHLEGAAAVALGDQTWSTFLLRLQEALPDTRFQSASPLTSELRMRKDAGEIGLLRAAAEATDRVVARLAVSRLTGRTEREISRTVAEWTVEEGHDVASMAIVASGPNAASPHHEPTDRAVQPGDTVVIDFGGRIDGYFSDTTRTFVAGKAEQQVLDAYAALERAQRAGVEAVRPGVSAAEVDRVTRAVIEQAGYGDRFVHRTGHGIGLEGHEHPYIVEGNDLVLEPGMTFSVEPGIYTRDGWGMRIEDIVEVTADGVERLNRSERRLYEVG